MLDRLEEKSIFFDKQTFYLFSLFFVLKIASFYLAPHIFLQAILVFILIILLGVLFFKNPYYALAIVLMEFFLGGSGHYFEFFGLSIRTVLTSIFLFLWFSYSLANKKEMIKVEIKNKFYSFLLFLIILVFFSFLIGLINGHEIKNIIADFIPYSIFLFIFPFENLFKDKNFKYFFIRLVIVFILGSAVFALFNFVLFRLNIFEIHGEYYKWFRDVLGGKITYLTTYFYRIVLPEHLLITPILVFIASLLMRDEKHHKMWRLLFLASVIILILNFSRAYFMAIFFAYFILKYKHNFLKWFKVSLWSIIIFIAVFVMILFSSSLGKSVGLELLGLRFVSMLSPEIELSANTRMLKLDPILSMIKKETIFGYGLGTKINYIDPVTYTNIIDPHFDWGYLEMLVELGIITSFLFLLFYLFLIFELVKKIKEINSYHDVYIGILAGFISLMVINITTPALFHTLGVFYLSLIIVFITKPISLYEEIISIIYRIFNKKFINQ
jgi:O-antigen ligase